MQRQVFFSSYNHILFRLKVVPAFPEVFGGILLIGSEWKNKKELWSRFYDLPFILCHSWTSEALRFIKVFETSSSEEAFLIYLTQNFLILFDSFGFFESLSTC